MTASVEAESAEVDRLEREFVGCRVCHTVTGDSGIATAVGFKRGCLDPVVVVRWDSEDDLSVCAPALLTRTASRAEVFSAARDRWRPEVLQRERNNKERR